MAPPLTEFKKFINDENSMKIDTPKNSS